MKKFPKKFILMQWLSLGFTVAFFALLYIVGVFFPEDDEALFEPNLTFYLIVLIVIVAIFVLTLVYSLLFYKKHYYTVTNNEITMQTGVLFVKKKHFNH